MARSNIALGYIARLTQIESELRRRYPTLNRQGLRDFAAIAAARQQLAVPSLREFKAWLDQEQASGKILPKSNLQAAYRYTLNQWTALCRYVEHGYLKIDNNLATPVPRIDSLRAVAGRRFGHQYRTGSPCCPTAGGKLIRPNAGRSMRFGPPSAGKRKPPAESPATRIEGPKTARRSSANVHLRTPLSELKDLKATTMVDLSDNTDQLVQSIVGSVLLKSTLAVATTLASV